MQRVLFLAPLVLTTACLEGGDCSDCRDDRTRPSNSIAGVVDDYESPTIEVEQSAVSFGAVAIGGDESASQILTVHNLSGSILFLSEISLADTTGPFSWSLLSSNEVQPFGEATVSIEFDPSSIGEFTNTLYIESNDPVDPIIEVELSGSGAAHSLQLTPAEFVFETIDIGCEAKQAFQIQNIGTADLVVTNVEFNTASFDLIYDANEETNGPLPWNLAPGETRQLSVSNVPMDEFSDTAFLLIDSNDPGNTTTSATIEGNGKLFDIGVDSHEQSLTGDESSFLLSQIPVPETIEVELDGFASSIGWEYKPATQAIDFDSDRVPVGGTTIDISYAVYSGCGE